jgi:LAS superfamily LD-carboxypeptidase LdcB
VRGITVAESIADNLERLLSAASSDGITFGGGGYRDPQQQQRLREAHCPNPRTSPASSCHPPTARPGHSMHERGLAIDFTVGGRTLTRSSSGFRWLRAHAARYGFYNLPSEAWHWSVNGN